MNEISAERMFRMCVTLIHLFFCAKFVSCNQIRFGIEAINITDRNRVFI